jgi:hypothetical protein
MGRRQSIARRVVADERSIEEMRRDLLGGADFSGSLVAGRMSENAR